MDKLTKKGLDGTQLKTIALVLMVLDHIHYFFEFTGCIPVHNGGHVLGEYVGNASSDGMKLK